RSCDGRRVHSDRSCIDLGNQGALLRWGVLQFAVIACLLTPAPAYADSVRVIVDRALIWSSAGFASIVLNQVPQGTVLEVLGRVDGWYEVVLPPGSSGPSGSVGYIRAVQVVIEPNAAAAPPDRRTVPTPQTVPDRPSEDSVGTRTLTIPQV